jgi:CDP-diacylglycerol--glycerol-3-phosphate 3-phosphatidyltransferase
VADPVKRAAEFTTIGTGLVLVSALAFGLGRRLGDCCCSERHRDTLDGQVARRRDGHSSGPSTTRPSTAWATAPFIGISAFFLTAPDVAYRVPAAIACMVAILSSLLVSYARARAEGLGIDCKVGIAQPRRTDPAGRTVLAGSGRRATLVLGASWPCSRQRP